jgi:hypothetical protein
VSEKRCNSVNSAFICNGIKRCVYKDRFRKCKNRCTFWKNYNGKD